MLVRRAEIKDIEKINELLLQVAMVHHYKSFLTLWACLLV